MTDLTIRPAAVSDAETIFTFVAGLIDDHLPGQTPWTSAERIRQDGFGPDPLFEALIAERGGRPMGIVHALYVLPEERRSGAARALMAAVARIALERGWPRVELFVEEGRPALRFYEAIGMRDLHHRHLRLESEALERLASEA